MLNKKSVNIPPIDKEIWEGNDAKVLLTHPGVDGKRLACKEFDKKLLSPDHGVLLMKGIKHENIAQCLHIVETPAGRVRCYYPYCSKGDAHKNLVCNPERNREDVQ